MSLAACAKSSAQCVAVLVLAMPAVSQFVAHPELTGAAVVEDPERVLADVRARIKQGLLVVAERRLADVPADAPTRSLASAALLAGNVDFERGAFDSARAHYGRAAALFGELPPGEIRESGLRIAAGNRDMAGLRLERQADLSRQAARLRGVTAGAAGVAALLVYLAGRLLSRRSTG